MVLVGWWWCKWAGGAMLGWCGGAAAVGGVSGGWCNASACAIASAGGVDNAMRNACARAAHAPRADDGGRQVMASATNAAAAMRVRRNAMRAMPNAMQCNAAAGGWVVYGVRVVRRLDWCRRVRRCGGGVGCGAAAALRRRHAQCAQGGGADGGDVNAINVTAAAGAMFWCKCEMAMRLSMNK